MFDDYSLTIPERKNIYYQRLVGKITNNDYPELSPDAIENKIHCIFFGFRLLNTFQNLNDLRDELSKLGPYLQTHIITIVNKVEHFEILIHE